MYMLICKLLAGALGKNVEQSRCPPRRVKFLHKRESPTLPIPPFTDLYHEVKILPHSGKINDVPSWQPLCAVSRILWFAASPNPSGSSLRSPTLTHMSPPSVTKCNFPAESSLPGYVRLCVRASSKFLPARSSTLRMSRFSINHMFLDRTWRRNRHSRWLKWTRVHWGGGWRGGRRLDVHNI